MVGNIRAVTYVKAVKQMFLIVIVMKNETLFFAYMVFVKTFLY